MLDIAEGESTILAYEKKLTIHKELSVKLNGDLQAIHLEKKSGWQNIEVQIILKGAMVEILLTGRLSDFDDAIMIYRKNVEDINTIIMVR